MSPGVARSGAALTTAGLDEKVANAKAAMQALIPNHARQDPSSGEKPDLWFSRVCRRSGDDQKIMPLSGSAAGRQRLARVPGGKNPQRRVPANSELPHDHDRSVTEMQCPFKEHCTGCSSAPNDDTSES